MCDSIGHQTIPASTKHAVSRAGTILKRLSDQFTWYFLNVGFNVGDFVLHEYSGQQVIAIPGNG
ncbi:MAG: hypothetical protein A3G25_21740 [Betaproteobacteria bacterium RIFCSPLOWO2_12_FULL_63_13]|nr:MAG: hypothetical protein A3G25_21740 [Betaproteobacteria bacterium RIFCSPLOWO2_12_FULL_63_13]